jgi:hypothetical protein
MGVATAISIGTAVAGAAASFTQAAQANKKAKAAQKDADEALNKARQRLKENKFAGLTIPKKAFEQARRDAQVTTATILKAATEGDQRGVAATAGKVQLASDKGTERIASQVENRLFQIDALKAKEDARLMGLNVGLDLKEIQGQQAAAQSAEAMAANSLTAGIQSLGSALSTGISALSDNPKTAEVRNLETAENLVERGQKNENIDAENLQSYIANNADLSQETRDKFTNIEAKQGVSMDATLNELFTELPIDTQKQIIQGLRRQVNPGGFLGLRGLFSKQ